MEHPKPDANKKEIVEVIKIMGCIWIDQDKYAGLDGFLVASNGIHAVEIKNPAYRWELTDREKRCREEIERLGQKYNIIQTQDEALTLAGFSQGDYLELAK
jgi:peptide methionine sulfoxide reductase MsrA